MIFPFPLKLGVPVNSRQQIVISSTGQQKPGAPGQDQGLPTNISATSTQKPGADRPNSQPQQQPIPGAQPGFTDSNGIKWASPGDHSANLARQPSQTGQATPSQPNGGQPGSGFPSQLDKKQVIGEFAGSRAAPGPDSVQKPSPTGPGNQSIPTGPITAASSGQKKPVAPGELQGVPTQVVTGVGKTTPFTLTPRKEAIADGKLHMSGLQGPQVGQAVPSGVASPQGAPLGGKTNQVAQPGGLTGQATPSGQKLPLGPAIQTAQQGVAPALDLKDTAVEITTASGKKVPVKLTQGPDGKVFADFIPTEVGESVLVVKVADQLVPNQPQKFTVSPKADPSKVKVEGPGIHGGEVGVPAKFRIDSRKAGVAPLGLGIDGPAEVKIETVDNKDGTVDVTYHPTEAGEYDVNVNFDGKPVPGSPFKAKIVPKGGEKNKPAIDVSGIKVYGPGIQGIFSCFFFFSVVAGCAAFISLLFLFVFELFLRNFLVYFCSFFNFFEKEFCFHFHFLMKFSSRRKMSFSIVFFPKILFLVFFELLKKFLFFKNCF